MTPEILTLAAPRLVACRSLVEAIARDLEQSPPVAIEQRMLQVLTTLGRVSAFLTKGDLPDNPGEARALLETKVELFALSASVQLARAEGADYGDALRSMLANQLVEWAEYANGPYSQGKGARVALRTLGYYLGKALNELSVCDTVRPEIVVQMHVAAMRMALVPETLDLRGDWVSERIVQLGALVKQRLRAGLLRQDSFTQV